MSTLQAVAMGLVIVFLDVGSDGWDWIADPLGWVLALVGLYPLKERLPAFTPVLVSAWICLVVSVLVFPPDSIDAIDPSLGWLFSIPTVAFCFLLSDSLADVTDEGLATRFRWLRAAFVVIGLLPLLVYVVGWSWMTIPTAVAAVLTNVALVFSVWAAGDEDEEATVDSRAARPARPVVAPTPPAERSTGGRRKKKSDEGFDAEAVKRRVRRERGVPEE